MQHQNSFVLPPNLGPQGLLQISTPTLEESAAAAALIHVAFGPSLHRARGLKALPTTHFFRAAKRRSRCGSVRGSPALSSHFSPGFAPQVGQRTAKASFSVAFMATQCAGCSPTSWSIVTIERFSANIIS
jgi:hypothetical protein